MSCYVVKYQDGEKHIFPVQNKAEYFAIRDEARNVLNARLAREGDEAAKRHLQQFSYNVVGEEGIKLKDTYMMGKTFFTDNDDTENRETFVQRCLEKKEEVKLRLLEYSTHGVHGVFERKEGLTILENQYRIAQMLGAEFDNEAKDPQRVVFSGPSSDIIYLDDALFDNTVNEEEAKAEYTALKERERSGQEEVPEWAKKRNKHTKPNTAPSISPQGGVNVSSNESLPPLGGGQEGGCEVSGGIDYARIIPYFFKLENSDYPNIMEGVRNDTLFNVCAKYLRYCCDHNATKMKELLYPDYSFGLPENEVVSIIRSALARERGLTPKLVKKILGMAKQTDSANQTYEDGVKTIDEMYGMNEEGESPQSWNMLSRMYPSVAECIATDLMLPRMPQWLETLLKICPPAFRYITLGASEPALMTLGTGIYCQFGSKGKSRLNGWSHLDGATGSGKRIIVDPIDLLLTPIKEQDDRNRAAINQAISNRDVNQNKDTLDPIPDLPIRILPPNTTRNAHIAMMANAKGAHTYTLATELSSLNINAAGYYNRADFARLLFENGDVGSVTRMDTQKKLVTQCNWNVTTSSTRDQTISHWSNVTDGSVGRVLFLLMPDTTFTETPDYVQYTEEERAYVIRAARIMTELKGLVETPRLSRTLLQWLHDVLVQTRQEKNAIKAILRKRSADIAFYFGTVIHLCFIVQQIMDEEDELAARSEALKKEQTEAANDPERLEDVENRMIALEQERAVWQASRLDLSRFHEKKACSDIGKFVAQYTLETQYALFGKKMLQQMKCSYEGVIVTKSNDDRLSQAPEIFRLDDLTQLFTDMTRDGIRKMVNRWEQARLIKRTGTEDRKAVYTKSTD